VTALNDLSTMSWNGTLLGYKLSSCPRVTDSLHYWQMITFHYSVARTWQLTLIIQTTMKRLRHRTLDFKTQEHKVSDIWPWSYKATTTNHTLTNTSLILIFNNCASIPSSFKIKCWNTMYIVYWIINITNREIKL
jgi:hypothetical protein